MELTMSLALFMTALGMVTVMIVLYLIDLLIRLLGKIFAEKKVSPAMPEAVVGAAKIPSPGMSLGESGKDASDNNEIIAVIAAAITSYLDGTALSSLHVKPYAVSAAWASASKIENTQNL